MNGERLPWNITTQLNHSEHSNQYESRFHPSTYALSGDCLFLFYKTQEQKT